MEWQTVGGVGLGREGLHERRTHAHHTSRTHGPGAGVRGQGEESSVGSLPSGTCTPSCGESGGQDLGAAPPRPTVLPWAPAPSDFRWLEKGVLSDLSSRLRLAGGQGEGRGLLLESPPKRGQKKTLSPPEAGDEASKHTVQNANPQATPTHSPIHSHAISPSSCSED